MPRGARPSLLPSELGPAVARSLRPLHPGRVRLSPPLPGLADGQGFRRGLNPPFNERETPMTKRINTPAAIFTRA